MNDDDSPPGAGLRTHTVAAGTMWLTQTPALSLWKGEVGLSDWLRVEVRDGGLEELRLTRPGPLRMGRPKAGVAPPDLPHELFVSSQAAVLRHDGVRWWLRRRAECHERVPTVVGARLLVGEEEAPLVHGTFLQVGRVRATLVDRRYVVPTVPAGAIDPHSGFLGRIGFEQEVAGFLALKKRGALIALAAPGSSLFASAGEHPPFVRALVAIHSEFPRIAIMHEEGAAALLFADDAGPPEGLVAAVLRAAASSGLDPSIGFWDLGHELEGAAKEIELTLLAVRAAVASGVSQMELRRSPAALRLASSSEVVTGLANGKRRAVLFALEDAHALARVGAQVLPALEHELAAVVAGHAPARALVAGLAEGVVGAVVGQGEGEAFAAAVQREWHSRPPIVDGHVELPRTLCVDFATGDVVARARALSLECADPQGVLSSLAGGLPYPIAGRVALAVSASSAVERVKLLFDVLEGAWRLVALILTAAYVSRAAKPGEALPGEVEIAAFARSLITRTAYPLGKWRELARMVAKALHDADDAIGQMARDLLRLRHEGNETLEGLANQLHPLRNQFAHNVYAEPRAREDLPSFEGVTREFLRALRPLAAWTLVTVEKTEPDLYGDSQIVEYVDHTGPAASGTRRRVGLKSPVRLANVVYLARFREGLVMPLEPFIRRIPRGNSLDLAWVQHLPRPGHCSFASVVNGEETLLDIQERRLSPTLRALIARAG